MKINYCNLHITKLIDRTKKPVNLKVIRIWVEKLNLRG